MKRMDDGIRQKVFERDDYTCRYCGDKAGPFHADHVYPYVKGGETSMKNLVTACGRCNGKKGSKVGVWPKPIGYFNERKEIKRKASHELKQNGALIFASLIPSWIMVSFFGVIPDGSEWVIFKIAILIWFAASMYGAVDWIWDFWRTQK